jgi:hypothetical protein
MRAVSKKISTGLTDLSVFKGSTGLTGLSTKGGVVDLTGGESDLSMGLLLIVRQPHKLCVTFEKGASFAFLYFQCIKITEHY